ncbi:MAG: FAD-dependent oxidoreductase, partial [Alicyclobacillus sp.]|nr:FAD-dependent oxidoreductase [Alicyclobacillus sp.]
MDTVRGNPADPPRQLGETDVLVVGGGFGGVAAAVAACGEGVRVCLLESRSYLGWERFAPLRPWATRAEMSSILRLSGAGDPAQFAVYVDALDEYALIPDRCKIYLEDLLLARGVTLFYQLHVTGWDRTRDGFRVHVCGKSGAFFIDARTVVDATPEGAVLQALPGCARRRWPAADAVRTAEFVNVDTQSLWQGSSGGEAPEFQGWRFHLGHEASGHVLAEYTVSVPLKVPSVYTEAARYMPRHTMCRVRRLMAKHPAFRAAVLTATSPETGLPPLWRAPSVAFDSGERAEPVPTPAGPIPLAAFQAVDGVWAVSGCADVDDDVARAIHADVRSGVEIGLRVGAIAARASGLNRSAGGSAGRVGQARAVSLGDGESAAATGLDSFRRPEQLVEVDVLVVGGGTSGAAAAITAGESARTMVVDMNHGLGGTGTIGGVNSYWYGHRDHFSQVIQRWVAVEHRWMGIKDSPGRWNIEAKMYALLKAA